MTVVRTSNTYTFLTTVLVLVLSVLACTLPARTTVPTTPVPTVVKALTTVPPKPKTPDNTRTTVKVTAYQALHVRQQPGIDNTVLGYLYNSDAVTLTGSCRSGWAQIVWKSATAWVKASYLSENICMTNKE
jgi:uncharacterized protein YgiM (DUF1202 family)